MKPARVKDVEVLMSDSMMTNQCDLRFHKISTHPLNGPGGFCLDNVSGHAHKGELLAIMGPSGSGKTTLLSCLSARSLLESGAVYLNGELTSRRAQRTRIGYVQQNDIFFPTLTLRQTLVYTALLRLSDKKYLTREDKLRKVDDIIQTLELDQCQDSVVGDDVNRGLSGGEKKRLSVACELITDPSILLIDEPTSGLDSGTAANLITTLKEYAQQSSKTIIMTVHQPSSRMFQMFDHLLLLADGRTVYSGPTLGAIPYMASLGMQLEAHYNPAEFLLEKMKSDKGKLCLAWEEGESWNNNENDPRSRRSPHGQHKYDDWEDEASTNPFDDDWQTTFSTQVKILAGRNILLAKPRLFSKVNLVQTVVLALMSGLIWFNTPREESSLNDLEGWMFFSSNYWMLFVLFQALWSFPTESAMVSKERKAGAYRFSSYYVAKLAEIPLEFTLPCLYLIICYPLVGGRTFTGFLLIILNQILSSLAAQSIGVFLGSILAPSTATTTAAIFTVGAQVLGGYLTTNIPEWLKVTSLVYNGLRNMQITEFFFGVPILCGANSDLPSCLGSDLDLGRNFIKPEDILERNSPDGISVPYWSHSVVLLGFILVFRIMTFMILRKSL